MRIPGYTIYHWARRILLVGASEIVALWLLARVLPGLHLEGWRAAVLGATAIGLLNALVRPALLYLTLPFTVLSFGFLTLVLNAFILIIAGAFVPGMSIDGLHTAIVIALWLSLINTLIASVFSLNEEDSFYRNVVKRVVRFSSPRHETNSTGLIIIEIDGLAVPFLRQAIRGGYMSTLSRWIASGSHKLLEWDCGLPSQTSSSQAGILFGTNHDIPAFRWYEKETGKLVVSNHPKDAEVIESRLPHDQGLLSSDGMSICNCLSGGATRSVGTLSTYPRGRVRRTAPFYFNYYINPYNSTRGLVLAMREIVVELWEGFRQELRDVEPRVSRRGIFPLLRAVATVLLQDMAAYLLMAEIFAGVPIAYTTFVGYDVVAHHAGPGRHDSFRILREIDRRINALQRATLEAPRPYRIVVLSDHGQTPSIPFRQLYELTLDELVRQLMDDASVHAPAFIGEGWGHLNALLTEAIQYERITGRAARRLLRGRTRDGLVELGPETEGDSSANVMMCVSGNLGLLYFTDEPGRVSFERIASQHPRLIQGLVAHEGIGFVMVHSEERGPIVLGKSGVHYLDEGRVDGGDPLAGYEALAVNHLKRLDSFPHSGDIVINGRYDPALEMVVTFEEFVGSHGGLGGGQTQPFLLYPSDCSIGDAVIENATDVYELLKRWHREAAA